MYKKIVCAGHVCLDITPVMKGDASGRKIEDILLPGKIVSVEQADIHTGGSVSNTGLALKLLGNEVALLGKIGNDSFGSIIKSIFAQYGASGLIEEENVSTSYSVVLAIPGCDRIFLHNPGANDTFTGKEISDSVLEDACLFHLGYPPLMRQMYLNGGKNLRDLLQRVKSQGIATSLDLAAVDPASEAGEVDWESILQSVLPYVDFFVPSFEELCYMLDRKLYNQLNTKGSMTDSLDMNKYVLPLADRVLDMGCGVALIKCGTSGMLFKTSSKERISKIGERLSISVPEWTECYGIQKCFDAKRVKSCLGAGDTSIAAFLSAVMRNENPFSCAAYAAAEGACCVTEYDALTGLKNMEQLKQMIGEQSKCL